MGSDLDNIRQRYSGQFDRIRQDGEALAGDGQRLERDSQLRGIVFDFDVQMNEQRWIFHLPSITMRQTNISMDLPQVTMRQQNIIFHTPSIRMEPRVVGRNPNFRMEGFNMTVYWTDIITHMPVTIMEEQRIIMGIPEVRIDRVDISLHVPEFRMEQQEWLVRIPEFKLRSIQTVTDDGNRLQRRGEALQEAGNSQAALLRREMGRRVSENFACIRGQMSQTRATTEQQFVNGLAQLDGAISQMRAQNINPEAVQTADGVVNLVQRRAEVAASQVATLRRIDESLNQLNEREQEAVNRIVSG
jgi:hypothetical protein